ncbi:MAG: signal transduction histidine kinase [Flavobacterium sp.]|jgi:signal transduction histidine kinase
MQAGLFINDKRAEWADFSVAVAKVNIKLFYLDKTGTNLTLAELSGAKIGVGPGTFQDGYLSRNYPEVIITHLTTDADFVDRILSGELTAVISEEPVMNRRLERAGLKGTIVSSQGAILTNSVHGTFLKDNIYLKSIINTGFRNIPIAKLRLIEKKWIPDNSTLFRDYEIKLDNLSLSEHEWLATNLNFSLGISPSVMPLEWIDENNLHQGVSADYVNILKDLLAIDMKPKPNLSWPEIIEAIKNKEIDVIPAIVKTKSRESFINFTKPYMSLSLVIASNKDAESIKNLNDLQGKIVAVDKSSAHEELLKRDHPNLIQFPVDNPLMAINLLEAKKVDAYVVDLGIITHHLNSGKFSNIKIAAYTQYKLKIAMGIRKGLEPLHIILDKALDSITIKEKVKIYNSWFTIRIDTGAKVTTFILWSLPIILLLMLIILFFFRMNQRQILETQLRQSQKLDALGKLTGGIAHDYNNMLGVILGYSSLLSGELEGQPKLLSYLEQISNAGERAKKFNKKILSFTSNQSSTASMQNINKVLLEQKDMLQTTLTAKIELIMDLDNEIWSILADKSELEDSILNIGINAMHAMSGIEHAKLVIRTKNQSISTLDGMLLGLGKGDYVQVSFTDIGCGMSRETKEKIFDPFFTTKGQNGTGLGLSQVFGFVTGVGGILKVISEPNQGCKFVMYFPHFVSEVPIVKANNQIVNAPLIVNALLKGSETILIVDDEVALGALASEILTQQGYNVLSVDNGKSAIFILEQEHIDLLLTDIIMPEMDGYQLASFAQENYPSMKIQLASGFPDDLNMKTIHKQLRQEMLHKPYDKNTLLSTIREKLDR